MALRSKLERGPAVAGLELAADRVRAVVGHREGNALRVTGSAAQPLRPGVVSGGLVADRVAVGSAIAAALGIAEERARATRIVAAIDGDDVRTYHVTTTFEREALHEAMTPGEVSRALTEARADAERVAREASANDAALRGVASVQLRDDVGALALDGRPLPSLAGFQGRYVEVRTDVALAPLVLASAALAALEAARRKGTVSCGAYALGRLLAASGLGEAGVVRLLPDATALAVVRGGQVSSTRAFGLGAAAFIARGERIAGDAEVWARCVVAALSSAEGLLPAQWWTLGVGDDLAALPAALAEALAGGRGGPVDIAPLRSSLASRVLPAEALRPDDLVAAGAALLAAEIA